MDNAFLEYLKSIERTAQIQILSVDRILEDSPSPSFPSFEGLSQSLAAEFEDIKSKILELREWKAAEQYQEKMENYDHESAIKNIKLKFD